MLLGLKGDLSPYTKVGILLIEVCEDVLERNCKAIAPGTQGAQTWSARSQLMWGVDVETGCLWSTDE